MEVPAFLFGFDKKRKRGANNKLPDCFEKDFVKVLEYIEILNDKTIDMKDVKKVVYLHEHEYNEGKKTVWIHMISLKYANVRSVRNVDTLKEQENKKKDIRDGDVEHTYFIVKFLEGEDGLCLFAKNINGVTMPRIVSYFDHFIDKYHKEELKDKVAYRLIVENVISSEFLENLKRVKRISAVTLRVNRKQVDISSHKNFAGKGDLKDEVDIILKPSGNGIFENTVKDFYKMYEKENIKSIRINADDNEGEPIRFDTEQMKERMYLTVEETYTGEPKEKSLKVELEKRIENY